MQMGKFNQRSDPLGNILCYIMEEGLQQILSILYPHLPTFLL